MSKKIKPVFRMFNEVDKNGNSIESVLVVKVMNTGSRSQHEVFTEAVWFGNTEDGYQHIIDRNGVLATEDF